MGLIKPITYFRTPTSGPYVTNGLILYWDGATYSGSGDWLDLSGNNNDGTFNGAAPTGDTVTNGGIVKFGGVNTNCVNTGVTTNGTNYTLMFSGQYVSGGSTGRICSSYDATNYNSQLGHWNGYTDTFYTNGWYKNGSLQNYNWSIQAATRNGSASSSSSYKYYFNNVLQTVEGGFLPNSSSQFGGISIASYGDYNGSAGEFSKCNVGFVMLYNRALTENELTINYNYFKDRYGL